MKRTNSHDALPCDAGSTSTTYAPSPWVPGLASVVAERSPQVSDVSDVRARVPRVIDEARRSQLSDEDIHRIISDELNTNRSQTR